MIVVVANHKGGVGKTSLAAHLLFRAAEHGVRSLAIDFDAQGNLTATLTPRDATLDHPGTPALFLPKGESGALVPLSTDDACIDMLPANDALTEVDKGNITSLFAAVERIRNLSKAYGLVVIDTAPALGLRLHAALGAAQAVVVPLVPEQYSLQGLSTLLQETDAVRGHWNHSLGQPLHVWNLVNTQSSSHTLVIEQMAAHFPDLVGQLHRHIAVADSLADRRPVWRRPTNRKAADEWREMTDRILALIGVSTAEGAEA